MFLVCLLNWYFSKFHLSYFIEFSAMTAMALKDKAADLDKKFKDITRRDRFLIPKLNGKDTTYLCGNSLGLQPKQTRKYVEAELSKWSEQAVEGHFKEPNPWLYNHRQFTKYAAELVGALPEEVVIMNTLTVNLHLAMVSFYRPTKNKYKIIMEAGAFPSDQYAIESQVDFHATKGGEHIFEPKHAIIEAAPRKGEELLRTEDIISLIHTHKDELALVLLGGVNYYSGQYYDIAEITKAAHQVGAMAGFDLAHAAGNLPLHLHQRQVDFAVWCNYKYVNGGPGAPSGFFVHQNHFSDRELPRFAGWWGHDETSRFKMEKGFKPMYGAEGWQLSNAPILAMAGLKAPLEIFHEVGIDTLRQKSIELTVYLEGLIQAINLEKGKEIIKCITPKNPEERGCQLSLVVPGYGKNLFEAISSDGVICDWREPSVIRIAPVPLYNTFNDVYDFYEILKRHL